MNAPLMGRSWLVLARRRKWSSAGSWGAPYVRRATANRPDLAADEIAVLVTLNVQREAFTGPLIEATIDVDLADVDHPVTVTAGA